MTTKEWLNRGYKLDDEINSLLKEQQEAFSKAIGVNYSATEKVQTSKRNTSEDRLINYASYSELIDNRVDELYAVKQEILQVINKVNDSVLRTLLIKRYINFQTWEEIAYGMNYSYRQICRLHGKALSKIRDVIECHI